MELQAIKSIFYNIIAFTRFNPKKEAHSQISLYSNTNSEYTYPYFLWVKLTLEKSKSYAKQFSKFQFIKKVYINILYQVIDQGVVVDPKLYTNGYQLLEYTCNLKVLSIYGEYSYPDMAIEHLLNNRKCKLEELMLSGVTIKNGDNLISLIKKFPSMQLTLTQIKFSGKEVITNIAQNAINIHFNSDALLYKPIQAAKPFISIKNLQISIDYNMTQDNLQKLSSTLKAIMPSTFELFYTGSLKALELFHLYKVLAQLENIEQLKFRFSFEKRCLKYLQDLIPNFPNLRLLLINLTGVEDIMQSIAKTKITKLFIHNSTASKEVKYIESLANLSLDIFQLNYQNMSTEGFRQVCNMVNNQLNLKEFRIGYNPNQLKTIEEESCLLILNNIEKIKIYGMSNCITNYYGHPRSEVYPSNLILTVKGECKLTKLDLSYIAISESSLDHINQILQLNCLTTFKIYSSKLNSLIPYLIGHLKNKRMKKIILRGSISEMLLNDLMGILISRDCISSILFENSGQFGDETHAHICSYIAKSIFLKSIGLIGCNTNQHLPTYFNAIAKCFQIRKVSLFDTTLIDYAIIKKDLLVLNRSRTLHTLCLSCSQMPYGNEVLDGIAITAANFWKQEFNWANNFFMRSLHY